MISPARLRPLERICPIASPRHWLPSQFFQSACRLGVPFTAHVLCVRMDTQAMYHCVPLRSKNAAHCERRFPDYVLQRAYRVSTSRFGIGQQAGSNCTPLGLHRIAEKFGNGWPAGTVFKSRKPIGFTWKGLPSVSITTRIMWLEGLDPGLNRGGAVDSHARYIYIHGTGDETTIGLPASHGCVHLAADDLIPLFDRLPIGSLVWIGR